MLDIISWKNTSPNMMTKFTRLFLSLVIEIELANFIENPVLNSVREPANQKIHRILMKVVSIKQAIPNKTIKLDYSYKNNSVQYTLIIVDL